MADVSQIKLPNGSVYDLIDEKSGYITAQYIEDKTDYEIPVSRVGEIVVGETAIGTDSTNFPTSKAVVDYVDERVVQEIDAIDVGVTKVNGKTGNVTLRASDVGAITESKLYDELEDFAGYIQNSIPTSTSQLTNDSGFISSYTETDPVFSASAAAGITSTDISNWNSKTSNTGTVTSVRVQATSPVHSSTSTAQSTSLNTIISLEDAYGDTKNPYGSKTKNYVLAAPSTAAGVPSFRALVSADIPDLSSIYLPLTGGQVTGSVSFGNSVTIDEATIGDLVVNGSASFTNNISANTINGVEVGNSPKFTDTVTTATTTGSGNAVTAITASNGALTVTKGTTFLTSHQDISGKADKATTLAGYGITDANIASGVITLGSNTITPLTSSSALSAAKLSGAIPSAVTATTQDSTDNSTKIATTAYVTTAIANLPEPMLFKGSVGTGGTITSLPTAAAANEGWTYKVITALSSPAAKVGDTVISNGSSWVVIPSGDEPSGTVTSVGITNGGGLSISGSPVTSSGTITIGHSNSVTAQTTQAVYPIKIDAQGHISAYGSAVTIPTVPSNIVNTITTTAGAHTTISSSKGNVSFNVPTKTSHLTNDSGFITSYTDEKVKYTDLNGLNSSKSVLFSDMVNTGGSGTNTVHTSNRLMWNDSSGNLYVYDSAKNKYIGINGNNLCIFFPNADTSYTGRLKAGSLTTDRTYTLPNASGTIALTSDIPSVYSSSNTGGYLTMATLPIYDGTVV